MKLHFFTTRVCVCGWQHLKNVKSAYNHFHHPAAFPLLLSLLHSHFPQHAKTHFVSQEFLFPFRSLIFPLSLSPRFHFYHFCVLLIIYNSFDNQHVFFCCCPATASCLMNSCSLAESERRAESLLHFFLKHSRQPVLFVTINIH